MWCQACSGRWPGCVGGTSRRLGRLEVAVSPVGGVLCLQNLERLQLRAPSSWPSAHSLHCLWTLYSQFSVPRMKEQSLAELQMIHCFDQCAEVPVRG